MRDFTRRTLLAFALASLSSLAVADAHAVCGDAVVDAGEDCDDGNVANWDCCSETCAFERDHFYCEHDLQGACIEHLVGRCDGAGTCEPYPACDFDFNPGYVIPQGVTFELRDRDGDRDDWLRWKVEGGRFDSDMPEHVPTGDPTVDTVYTFCMYDVDDVNPMRVLYEKSAGTGAGWKRIKTGWKYRERGENGASLSIRAQRLSRVRIRGAQPPLPAAVSTTTHFDRPVTFGLISDAGYCHLQSGGIVPGRFGPTVNDPGHYRIHRNTRAD